jgi:hypothetical protein
MKVSTKMCTCAIFAPQETVDLLEKEGFRAPVLQTVTTATSNMVIKSSLNSTEGYIIIACDNFGKIKIFENERKPIHNIPKSPTTASLYSTKSIDRIYENEKRRQTMNLTKDPTMNSTTTMNLTKDPTMNSTTTMNLTKDPTMNSTTTMNSTKDSTNDSKMHSKMDSNPRRSHSLHLQGQFVDCKTDFDCSHCNLQNKTGKILTLSGSKGEPNGYLCSTCFRLYK